MAKSDGTAKAEREGEAERKSARTRQRILDAAAHVLSIRGFAATRLTEIALEADLQAPTIYYYFPSREALVDEVIWTGISLTRQHVSNALAELPPEASPMDRIATAVEAHLRLNLELSDYATASTRNSGQVPDSVRERYLAEARMYGAVWRELLDDARAAGVLRPELDPTSARMLILGAINWTAEWWNPRRGSLNALIRTTRSLVVNGLSDDTEGATRT